MTSRKSPLNLRFLAVLILAVAVGSVFAQADRPWSQNISPLPAPTGFVNDYVGVIDPATKHALETKLKTLRDTSEKKIEIGIAVIKTTGDRAIFDYSLAVARGWKIGSTNGDNPSALLLVAIEDRKYFTQVSKDLEDELPDGVAGSLQRQYLVPEFKKGNYAKGISDTIDAFIATIRNKGNPPVAASTPQTGTTGSGGGVSFFGIFCCAVIGLVIFLIILSRNSGGGGPSAKDRSRWGGGAFGGGGGGSSALPWIIGGILGGSGGSGGSSSSDWGGSSSSGGSDWGGFGGGGDFGGGGAGGDW